MVALCVSDEEVSLDVEDRRPPNTVVVDHHYNEDSLFYHHTGVETDSWERDLPTSSTSIEASPHGRKEAHYLLNDVSSFLAFHLVLLYELSSKCMSLVGFFHV